MNKDNQKTQNKVIVAISLTTGGALAGNWLRGVVDTSGMATRPSNSSCGNWFDYLWLIRFSKGVIYEII